ncbi:hypothetical protein BaRGS_00017275 [Batillaria attramentaria]|uniref:Uncharacterized protein n=1 Tax=Batillaria attramentaria TaxID=370345 RepID=A0ABD0KWL1_9CAEN
MFIVYVTTTSPLISKIQKSRSGRRRERRRRVKLARVRCRHNTLAPPRLQQPFWRLQWLSGSMRGAQFCGRAGSLGPHSGARLLVALAQPEGGAAVWLRLVQWS